MTEDWTCQKCHHQNPGTMQFCPHCGAAKPSLSAKPDSRNTPLLQSDNRWWWIGSAIILILICVVLAVTGGLLLGRQVAGSNGNEHRAAATAVTAQVRTPTPAVQVILSTRVSSTDTPAPTYTPTPQSTATPTATSGPSLGDRISLPTATPTPTPEGVIVFLSSRNYDPQPTPNTGWKWGLYAMNLDGSNQVKIDIPAEPQRLGYYGLYPYYKQNQIVSIDFYDDAVSVSGTIYDIAQLNHQEPLLPFGAGLYPFSPSWSKNGDIAFSRWTVDKGNAIYYLGYNQSKAKQVTNLTNDKKVKDNWPVWSPDGEWIAFSRIGLSSDPQTGIWLVRPDGSELHQIVAMYTRIIAWSPDGTKLAFQGRYVATGLDIWVTDADGSNQKQLSFFPEDEFDTFDMTLAWSPDSKRIIFQMGALYTSGGQLYIVDADGSTEPKQLTFEGEYNGNPIWLPISMDEILANAPTPAPPTPTPKPVALVPPAPSSCPAEGVQITSPRAGTRFTQRYNYILGTASINRFNYWKLEYSTNPNGGWQYLFEHNYPVKNGQLMMLDASTVPRGPYGLRLTVVDETGNYPEPCVVWFTNGY